MVVFRPKQFHFYVVDMWVSLKIVYPMTQWFCWSFSLLNGYFIGGIPHFQTYPCILWTDTWIKYDFSGMMSASGEFNPSVWTGADASETGVANVFCSLVWCVASIFPIRFNTQQFWDTVGCWVLTDVFCVIGGWAYFPILWWLNKTIWYCWRFNLEPSTWRLCLMCTRKTDQHCILIGNRMINQYSTVDLFGASFTETP